MKKSNRTPGGEWESGATYRWWCFTGTSTLPSMAHPQVLLHIVLCGNSPTYKYWNDSLKIIWYDTSVKAECLTGGASTTPTPIMTSDPVTHCLSLQLKSYSLLSDLSNKVTHCLSTFHTSGIYVDLLHIVTQSSTLPLSTSQSSPIHCSLTCYTMCRCMQSIRLLRVMERQSVTHCHTLFSLSPHA